MLTRIAPKLSCIVLGAFLIAATPAGSSSTSRFDFLTGSFNCTSTDGKPYVEAFTRVMTSNWIRGTDTADDGSFAGEHTFGYDTRSKTWSIVSIYGDGTVSVDHTATEGPMTTVYPPGENTTVTITRLSDTSYSVEGQGSYKGRSLHFRDTCTKRV